MSKKTKKVDEFRFEEELTRIFNRKTFKKEVKELRVLIGVPKDGFKEDQFKEYFTINTQLKSAARLLIDSLLERYSIPLRYKLHVFGKIYFNDEYQILDNMDGAIKVGQSCALYADPASDCSIELKIYDSATKTSIKDFIDDNWDIIESHLNKNSVLPKQVRKRPSNKNHKKILEIYRMGFINSNGFIKKDKRHLLKQDTLEFINRQNKDTVKSIIRRLKKEVH